jgi:hypothetical protein
MTSVDKVYTWRAHDVKTRGASLQGKKSNVRIEEVLTGNKDGVWKG